uniref:Uncharacterized protein n=1 Tax=Aegilops tauschii subsp. strangulata TaxID=200361 RepID=A0A453PI67_AEGTS
RRTTRRRRRRRTSARSPPLPQRSSAASGSGQRGGSRGWGRCVCSVQTGGGGIQRAREKEVSGAAGEVLAGGGRPPWLARRAPRSWRGFDFSGIKERQRGIQGGGEVGEEGRGRRKGAAGVQRCEGTGLAREERLSSGG